MNKYMLHPGWVQSQSDGDRHYISAQQLCDLYGVNISQCEIYKNEPGVKYSVDEWKRFKHLRPRYDGKYLREE